MTTLSLPSVGARARLACGVERYPHFRIEAGATGTITEADEEMITLRMDLLVPGAEEWNNEVCWTPALGEAMTGPGATSAEQVTTAFLADAELLAPLRFVDHHRQRYAEKVRIEEAGEFLIGDYRDDGTTGGDGEFKVTLVELHGDRRWSLYPHLEVFGDGVEALRRAIDAGLLKALTPVRGRDAFSRRLIALGFHDRSDRPLPDEGDQREGDAGGRSR